MSDPYAPDPSSSDPSLSAAPGQRAPAELGDRFLAKLIDFVIVGVVYGIIAGVLAVGVAISTGSGWLTGLVTSLILVVLLLGYFVAMEASRGQTVGKMVLNLHVTGRSGGTVTTEEALRRNIWMAIPLLGIVPFVGWLLQAVAWIAALVTIALGINNDPTRRQAWHDHLGGGTQVVKQG